jgi:DNA gyrase subunit B
LITALGCGIGREEYDPAKVRYHRIIIMTDADVDGSHIRTLLLTFFYRQMPELIERGHIYIAQPPLYKLKHGKQEQYIKDDEALDNYLMQLALDGAAFYSKADHPPIAGQGLEKLIQQYQKVAGIIARLHLRYPTDVLTQMLYLPTLTENSLRDQAVMTDWCESLQTRLTPYRTQGKKYQVTLRPEGDYYLPHIELLAHGQTTQYQPTREFYASREYQQMGHLAETLAELVTAESFIVRDSKRREVSEFGEVAAWLLSEAKQGQVIQRYKGLGEMNPDQLWETTMDPEHRRLLQVKIEDAVAADGIFTTLMGDQVEPRREFIETNALAAVNLDI